MQNNAEFFIDKSTQNLHAVALQNAQTLLFKNENISPKSLIALTFDNKVFFVSVTTQAVKRGSDLSKMQRRLLGLS